MGGLLVDLQATVVGLSNFQEDVAMSCCCLSGVAILAVDDNQDCREMISRMVKSHGATVMTISDGNGVVEAAVAGVDVTLLDMMMPGKDGVECARLLSEAKYNGTVIIVSACALKHEVQAAKEAGIKHYLTKPFTERKLLDTIRDAHFGSRHLRPCRNDTDYE